MKIQFLNPNLTSADIKEAVKVLKSGWLTYGDKTRAFEESLAKFLGVKKVIFNSSGTAALHVALLAADISKGDEVITTPLSYVATSNVILYCGAKPVFVDVETGTGNIDVGKIEKAITKKTRAIVPVHLYGQMVDMKKLKKIADKHKILIIEDSAHAIESKRDRIRPGNSSFASCHSFHAAKNITSGEGGAVAVNSEELAEKIKLFCEGGVKKERDNRFMVALGYKYSGTNFQAALLLNQLERIESQHKKREKLWHYYAKKFTASGINFPKIVPNSKHAYHMFVVWVDPKRRDEIRKKIEGAGIQTSIHYNPIHLEPYYRKTFGYKRGDFPIAERLGFSTITLPLYPSLTKAQQDYVIKKVIESVKKA